MLGKLKKLRIEAYAGIDLADTDKVHTYDVLFNPATFQRKYEIEYEEAQGQGTTGTPQKLGKIKPQEYSFEFLFDGTGAAGPVLDVAKEIDTFLTVTGKMERDIHRPLYLKISWGALLSKCVLKRADITYNLFKPDGFPLRAKVSAVFTESIDEALRVAKEGKNSPDLSHVRQVRQGDNLPLMTYRIYGDSRYYPQVARYNGLHHFRDLQPGTQLVFPPLTDLLTQELNP